MNGKDYNLIPQIQIAWLFKRLSYLDKYLRTLKKNKRCFQFGPIEKRDQITFPQLFTLGWKVQGQYLIWFIL